MPSQLRGRLDMNLPLTYDALMHKVNPNTTRMAKCRNSSGPLFGWQIKGRGLCWRRQWVNLHDISSSNLDQVEHVPQDVVLRALILKLGMTLVFAIADVARSLLWGGSFHPFSKCGCCWSPLPIWSVQKSCQIYRRSTILMHPMCSRFRTIDVYTASQLT